MVEEQSTNVSITDSLQKHMNLLETAPQGFLKNYLKAIYVSGGALVAYCLWTINLAWQALKSYRLFDGSTSPIWMFNKEETSWLGKYDEFVSFANFFGVYLLFVASIIVWTYQTHTYVQPIAPKERKWGKGWALGGWFTPVGFLFIPFLVNRETERIVKSSSAVPSQFGFIWFYSVWLAILCRGIANQGLVTEQFFYLQISAYVALIVAVIIGVLYFADLTISTHQKEFEIESAEAQNGIATLDSPPGIATGNPQSAAEQIRALGQLLLEGHISEEEFYAKKTELLKQFG